MRTNHFNSDSRVMAVESQTVTNRLDLDALGVVEMNDAEMCETRGGGRFMYYVGRFCGGVVNGIYSMEKPMVQLR